MEKLGETNVQNPPHVDVRLWWHSVIENDTGKAAYRPSSGERGQNSRAKIAGGFIDQIAFSHSNGL